MSWLEEREAAALDAKRDYKIAMANEVLDTMRMGLSAQQQDILDFMLKEIKPNDAPNTRYSISIADYCRVNGISYEKSGKNYQDVKKGLKALNNSCRWIETGEHTSQLIYWLSEITLDNEKGVIEYNIDPTMRPYLFDLINKGYYTLWSEKHPQAIRSQYAKHLYKILLRYYGANIHKPLISIDKLKMLLEAEHYTRFPDFRVNVLEMAKREIGDKTPMDFMYFPRKSAGSRGYTHIEFIVKMPQGWGCKILNDDEMPF